MPRLEALGHVRLEIQTYRLFVLTLAHAYISLGLPQFKINSMGIHCPYAAPGNSSPSWPIEIPTRTPINQCQCHGGTSRMSCPVQWWAREQRYLLGPRSPLTVSIIQVPRCGLDRPTLWRALSSALNAIDTLTQSSNASYILVPYTPSSTCSLCYCSWPFRLLFHRSNLSSPAPWP